MLSATRHRLVKFQRSFGKKKEIRFTQSSGIHLVIPQPTGTYIQETLSRQDTPGPGR